MSYEEQTRGWLAVMAQARSTPAQIQSYRRLKIHLNIYCRVAVVDFNETSAAEFERLRKMYPRSGTMDLKMAAIAIANNATLLTRNLSDFGKFPELKAEDGVLNIRKQAQLA